jgi:histidyl-tRNA synthetase
MERLIALMEAEGRPEPRRPDIFIAALGEQAEKRCFNLALELRKSGFLTEMDYGSKGLKAQMKRAGKLDARRVLIVGEDELASGKAVLRDMDNQEQQDLDLKKISEKLEEIIRKDEHGRKTED